MRVVDQPGYVLHVRAWRETSLLLECLTRDHGRVGMVARGAKRPRSRLSRSILEPFQPLRMGFSGGGELLTLTAVEATGRPWRSQPASLLAGLYANELLVRMLPRQDPHPRLLARYQALLAELAGEADSHWTLRRFERDLLAELGYALVLTREADTGAPVDPAVEYHYQADSGPMTRGDGVGVRLLGADLLALATDQRPRDGGMTAVRRLLRALLHEHLGGRELQSSRVLGDAVRRAGQGGARAEGLGAERKA